MFVGKVTHILYEKDSPGPPILPSVVLVQLDNYTGPGLLDHLNDPNLERIVPIKTKKSTSGTKKFAAQQINLSRRQFPLALSYARTIDKAEGATFAKAIVDIGSVTDRKHAVALEYVGISRVKSDMNLLLVPNSFHRWVSVSEKKAIKYRRQEVHRLGQMAELTKRKIEKNPETYLDTLTGRININTV